MIMQIKIYIKDFGMMIKDKVREFFNQEITNIKEHGKMIKSMAKEFKLG